MNIIQKWTTYDLLVITGVGIAIGVVLSLLFICDSSTTITDHEVVIENFLGYKELIVVKILR
jgi:hypothetical protein